jgi:serine/threonine protein kinase
MELLIGESLSERLQRKNSLSGADILEIFKAVAAGMAHAHRQGIVHRDIKPGNIFLEQEKGPSAAKIVDFGLAKLAVSRDSDAQSMTAPGMVFGSPLYMSPEQCVGLEIDARTDIYSFGCTLFHALTGAPPFAGTNAMATIAMHQEKMLPKLGQAAPEVEFPPELDGLMAKLLAKNTERRYQTFEEVERGLTRLRKAFSSLSQTYARADGSDQIDGNALPNAETTGNYTGEYARRVRYQLWISMAVALVFVALIGGGGLYLFWLQSRSPHTPPNRLMPASDGVHKTTTAAEIKSNEPARTAGAAIAKAKRNRTPPVSSAGYFSHPVAGGRQFEFPPRSTNLGQIKLYTAEAIIRHLTPTQSLQASGRVFVPVGMNIVLNCQSGLSEHPEYLRKFRPTDLYGIEFGVDGDWGRKYLAEVAKLGNVKMLQLRNLEPTGNDLSLLNPLNSVESLYFWDADKTGADLAQIAWINRVKLLDVSKLTNVSPLLLRLKGSQSIVALHLRDCHMGDAEVEQLVDMPHLHKLSLSGNKITAAGLRSVSRLPAIDYLSLGESKIDQGAINELKAFKRLKNIALDYKVWLPNDRERLQKALPQCSLLDANRSAKDEAVVSYQ